MASKFEKLIIDEFSDLAADYNLTFTNIDRSRGREDILLKNETTGIRLSWEQREREVFAMLIQLKEGEVPPYGRGWFDVADLVDIVGGQDVSLRTDKRELDRAVKKMRDLISRYCGSVLNGDFSVLPEIEEVQRRRAENQG